ncbi:AI-2E family transporter [Candidatus Gracilibacteria bacterium]|nr:AI-2E family transporter [Candidatus Gracilibacteria bacterium]
MFKKQHPSVVSIPILIITVSLVIYILSIGQNLIIPFLIALLFSFAIIALMQYYRSLYLPKILAFLASIATYAAMFWVMGQIINSNVEELIRLLPEYQDKIYITVLNIFEYFGITPPTSVNEVLREINLQSTFSLIFSGVTSIFSQMGVITFYVIFILLEYRYFGSKLKMMIREDINRQKVIQVIEKIKSDVKSYFVIKAGVSFILAILSYLVMTFLGLDFALFWTFIIFVLNFIPFIGSIIAVTFPILFSLVQFDSYYISIGMATGLIAAQVFMGNIIEPKFVGNRLNLSPLVIILSLGFWGNLWGVVGMLLSVPITVILNIILAKIPATRSIAVLLSEKGELDVDEDHDLKANRKELLEKVKKRFKIHASHKKITKKKKK